MPIKVNGVEIKEAAIEAETLQHAESDDPRDAAIQTLALRELMMQRARSLGIQGESVEETLAQLIEQEVSVEPADEVACRRFYDENQSSFVRPETRVAHHILLQLGDVPDPELINNTALRLLSELQADPARFSELAREYSACPSSEEGGYLGQIARGQTVPEFEQALFALAEGALCTHLVQSQFGVHIIKCGATEPVSPLSFDEVKDQLSAYLTENGLREAMQPYLLHLVSQASIEGYQMPNI